MQILSDIPIAYQLAIYAEVMKVAEECNLSFGKAFYVLMQHYKEAVALAALEEIPIEIAIERLNQHGYSTRFE